MEKENEIIENLFESNVDDENNKIETNESNNAFVDLPPVAPVNYEEEVKTSVEFPAEETVQELKEGISKSINEVTPEVENDAFVDLPPVAPVNYEEEVENLTESSLETTDIEGKTEEEAVESSEINSEILNKEVLEHPDAKIKLNNEQEEKLDKKELEELQNVKLMDNGSLKFVLILGIILLIVIFLIPVVAGYIRNL